MKKLVFTFNPRDAKEAQSRLTGYAGCGFISDTKFVTPTYETQEELDEMFEDIKFGISDLDFDVTEEA